LHRKILYQPAGKRTVNVRRALFLPLDGAK
jgi:hypothetical protein